MNENSKQTLIFDENLSATVLPGMVQSVKDLISLVKYQPVENFELGRFTSAFIIGGHTAELLLKYKLSQEGTSFAYTHDLYDLYKLLRDESKEAIQREFENLLLETNTPPESLPAGWNAESVVKSIRLVHVEWRYIMEKTRKKSPQSSSVDSHLLHTIVVSIFRRTAIVQSRTTKTSEELPPHIQAIAEEWRDSIEDGVAFTYSATRDDDNTA